MPWLAAAPIAAAETCPKGPDADGDGVCDARDNCLLHTNSDQLDGDLDGYGNVCDGDFDGDGAVNASDAGLLLTSFGLADPDDAYDLPVDADGSGNVDIIDTILFDEQRRVGKPGPSGLACAGTTPCAATLQSPSQAEHVLARTTYGATPALRARIAALGVQGFIDEQLAPADLDDPALDARLAALPTLDLSISEIFDQYERVPASWIPFDEATDARVLRILSSERQLEEQLVDFWLNHFNVNGALGMTRLSIGAYERDAIRPHVLGRFADLLRATARTPAMLAYLDNQLNFSDSLNENYARELLELHTIGVDAGFSQGDVIEVARALSGWGIDYDVTRGFRFHSWKHDDGAKRVLQMLDIEAGSGEAGGTRLLNFLATRPETAVFVCEKLVRRFVDEDPPPRTVAAAATRFTLTGGDLKAVMETILRSPEFLDEPERRRTKVKRPAVLLASLSRALESDVDDIAPTTEAQLITLGEGPYLARPPTGYPDSSEFWASPGTLVSALNYVERAARGLDGYTPQYDIDEAANLFEVVDALIAQLLPDGVSPATRNGAIVLGHTLRMQRAEHRIEQIAAYLLSSPEFLLH